MAWESIQLLSMLSHVACSLPRHPIIFGRMLLKQAQLLVDNKRHTNHNIGAHGDVGGVIMMIQLVMVVM